MLRLWKKQYGTQQESSDSTSVRLQVNSQFWNTPERDRYTEVSCDTLDNIVGDRKIDFAKIDVQGAEVQVLEGGARFLRTARKLVVETHDQYNVKRTIFPIVFSAVPFLWRPLFQVHRSHRILRQRRCLEASHFYSSFFKPLLLRCLALDRILGSDPSSVRPRAFVILAKGLLTILL